MQFSPTAVDAWREEFRMNVLLENVEAYIAHYLVGNKIQRDPTHVLSSVKPSISIIVFSPTCGQTKQN
jgi:hypothetical protein